MGDVAVTDFKEKKESGYYIYGQLPICTTGDGMKMYQTGAIVRYVSKCMKGQRGECLYPSNKNGMLMHAIDDILELNNDFIMTQMWTIGKDDYDNRLNSFFEKLPVFLNKLKDTHDRMKATGNYICANQMTLADIIFFASFWKLIYNPEADKDMAENQERCQRE